MARLPSPSPAVRWILTIGIVVVLLVTGYFYYGRLKEEQANHLTNIAHSNQTIETFRAVNLDELEAEIADLSSRAESADRRYGTLRAKYLSYVHSIEIEEALYDAAKTSEVTITSLTCAGPQVAEMGSETFHSYIVSIDVEAPVPPQILNFIIKFGDEFETGIIDFVDMTMPRPTEVTDSDTGTTETVPTEGCTSTMQLRVLYLPSGGA
ncbi:MAG: hypothetical protein JW846_07845 [Dehalococcoidia bacterium]|nr:hypothetical protein [Dehalococcoidia bacterium]